MITLCTEGKEDRFSVNFSTYKMSNQSPAISTIKRGSTLTWEASDPKDLRDGAYRAIRARCLSDFRVVFTVDHISQFGRIFAVIYPSRIVFSRWLMQVCKLHENFLRKCSACAC